MKFHLLILLICTIHIFSQAQSSQLSNNFGFALNSSLNSEVSPVRLIPSLTYTQEKSQVELGIGIHPFIDKDQTILSGDFHYKYFPNGMEKKFNMYFISCFSYIYNSRDTYYPSTYNYFFLNGGYGFDLNPFANFHMGTNISIGAFTYSKKSDVPNIIFASKKLFDIVGYHLAFQFYVGYRF